LAVIFSDSFSSALLEGNLGFYIRKSVSAGPFRFNLSSSGLGMSVGVKGFRVGTGPRGNYVHMGRGGLYYRASLGGSSPRPRANAGQHHSSPALPLRSLSDGVPVQIETGNVLNMKPVQGADIVDQINEKMASPRSWPWILGLGTFLGLALLSQPEAQPFAIAVFAATAVFTAICARWDQARRTVVVMYDLADEVTHKLSAFSNEFEKLASASRIWNVDTARNTDDWKRNAGAGRLLSRKAVQLTQGVPVVVKTNVSIPAIIGGKQNVYFFPDVAVVQDGNRVGAIPYEQLSTYWNTTVFIEVDGVPSDSQVVGYTWRFVNKKGGPDRRFNNNRQIPRVLYQQMGLRGSGQFQKILHISCVTDRTSFDQALRALGSTVQELKLKTLAAPQGNQS
jgi:hypothetical protein